MTLYELRNKFYAEQAQTKVLFDMYLSKNAPFREVEYWKGRLHAMTWALAELEKATALLEKAEHEKALLEKTKREKGKGL